MPSKKCICSEMKESNPFTSVTFTCPKHGKVTIDQRMIPAVSQPIYVQPYTPAPNPYWTYPVIWGSTETGGTSSDITGTLTFSN